jgi:hypothetical protein
VTDVDSVLQSLHRLRKGHRPNEWTAACPAHDDRSNSLSISWGNGRYLWHCFAGCTVHAIAKAMDRPFRELISPGASNGRAPAPRPSLTVETFASGKGLPVSFLRALGVVDATWTDERGHARAGVQITYRDRDGQPAPRQRRRTALAAKDGSWWSPGTGAPIPYGRWKLDDAQERGELLLVEGETDALAAWVHNVPALGLPGADMASKLAAEDLAGIGTLWVVQEPDRGGETFVAGVANRLHELRWAGRAMAITFADAKDVLELHQKAGPAFAERLAAAKDAAVPIEAAAAAPLEGGASASAAANAGRFSTLTWAEMVASPVAPIDYHWRGWVPRATVTLIAGAGESLKSWLALFLAVMTAAGRSALMDPEASDGQNLAPGPVLYLTAENAIDEEKRRCGLLKAGFGLPDTLPLTFVPAERLSLGNDHDHAEVVALVRELTPALIVIDSAIALSGIKQENDNAEVRAFMQTRILPLAREHGATVYVNVHSPKPPTQPGARFTDEHVARGAGDWRNAADVMLYLRRDATLGEQAVVIRHAKCRIGPRHRPLWFALEDTTPGQAVQLVYGGTYDEDSGQGASAGLARAVSAAVDRLKATPSGIYRAALEQDLVAAGVSKATFRRALDVLRAKTPWPYGSQRGRKHAVVDEDRQGKRVFLTFLPTAWGSFSESEDD